MRTIHMSLQHLARTVFRNQPQPTLNFAQAEDVIIASETVLKVQTLTDHNVKNLILEMIVFGEDERKFFSLLNAPTSQT